MSRNLCFLNLLLLALAVFAGSQLRIRWRAEKAREAAEFPPTAPSIPPAAFTAVRVPPVTRPVTYVAIAQKDLFDPSRNPDLPVEIILPPPKPPIPPLPVYHGAMNLGDGPMAGCEQFAFGKVAGFAGICSGRLRCGPATFGFRAIMQKGEQNEIRRSG